ncbi:hypothetical protein ACHQM5_014563 [Ranunculus cassubicifolius]
MLIKNIAKVNALSLRRKRLKGTSLEQGAVSWMIKSLRRSKMMGSSTGRRKSLITVMRSRGRWGSRWGSLDANYGPRSACFLCFLASVVSVRVF